MPRRCSSRSKAYHTLRVLGTCIAVLVTASKLLGGTVMSSLPDGVQALLMQAWSGISSWPVYAISLVLAGAWLQDTADALVRETEGRPSWLGCRALRARLRFTRWILDRPRFYSNEHKIARELSRADEALARGGFATLHGFPVDASGDQDAAKDYLDALAALIAAVGCAKASAMSHAIKSRLLPDPSLSAGPPASVRPVLDPAPAPHAEVGAGALRGTTVVLPPAPARPIGPSTRLRAALLAFLNPS